MGDKAVSAAAAAKRVVKEADAIKEAVQGEKKKGSGGKRKKYKKDGKPAKWWAKIQAARKRMATDGKTSQIEIAAWLDTGHAVKIGDSALVTAAKVAGGSARSSTGSMVNTGDRRQSYRDALSRPEEFLTSTPGDVADHVSDTIDTLSMGATAIGNGNYRTGGRYIGTAVIHNLGPAVSITRKVAPRVANKAASIVHELPFASTLLGWMMSRKKAAENAPSKMVR